MYYITIMAYVSLNRIRPRHLLAFLEIARARSVSKAAHTLGLTQPALSKTLADLEKITGARLMVRNRSGVSLTGAGETFLHYATTSYAALRQGLDALSHADAGQQPPLLIGVLPSVAARLMPDVVERFRARHSGVVLSIATGANGLLIEQLRLGALDLVIGRLGSPALMHDLAFVQLYSERVTLVVRPGHPLVAAPDISRLAQFPILMPERGAAIRPLVERFMIAYAIGLPDDRIETVAEAFGRAYTRRSDAIWVISRGVVALDIEDGTLIELPFDMAMTLGPVGLTTRADGEISPALRALMDVVREVAADIEA